MIHHEPTKFTISLQKNIETFKEQLDHTTELTVRMNRVGRLQTIYHTTHQSRRSSQCRCVSRLPHYTVVHILGH